MSILEWRLEPFAEMGGEDFEFFAVFGDGAAGYFEAFFGEGGNDGLVGEGGVSIFGFNDVLNGILDDLVGDALSVGGFVAGGEEVFHLEGAARGLHVFAIDGAADRGFVDANDVGDLGHGEGAELGDAVVEEVALGMDDFGSDVEDGLLALVDAFDEEHAGADFVADVGFDFGSGAGIFHELPVMLADVEMGDLVVVDDYDVVVLEFLDDDFGEDVAGGIGGEAPSGFGLEGSDEFGGLLDVFEGEFEEAGEVVEFSGAEGGEVVADEAGGEGVGLAESFELDEEAFAEVAGADADGVEILDEFKDGFDLGGGVAGGEGEFFEGGGEVAVVVDASDDQFADALFFFAEIGEGELVEKVLLEGFDLGDGVEEELAAGGVLGGVGSPGLVLEEVFAPFVVEFGEDFEFVVEGFGIVGLFFGFGFEAGGGVAGFLEGGVLLHFLADEGAEFEDGDLEQFEGLAELRSKGLLHPLLLGLG